MGGDYPTEASRTGADNHDDDAETDISRRSVLAGVGTATAGLAGVETASDSAQADVPDAGLSKVALVESLNDYATLRGFLGSQQSFLQEVSEEGHLPSAEIDELLQFVPGEDETVPQTQFSVDETTDGHRARVGIKLEHEGTEVSLDILPQTGEMAVLVGSDPDDAEVFTNRVEDTYGPSVSLAQDCECDNLNSCTYCGCTGYTEFVECADPDATYTCGVMRYSCVCCCSGTRWCSMWGHWQPCYSTGPHGECE